MRKNKLIYSISCLILLIIIFAIIFGTANKKGAEDTSSGMSSSEKTSQYDRDGDGFVDGWY